MARITLKGNPIHTVGELPAIGASAPGFTLVGQDLKPSTLADFAGRKKVLNIFPSLDTPTCAVSVRTFNKKAAGRGVAVLNVSADLPFAAKRVCAAEGIEGAVTLSTLRSTFGKDYGVQLADGPLAGLMGRAVIVLDASGKVLYTQLVPEIAQEPDYDAALAALA